MYVNNALSFALSICSSVVKTFSNNLSLNLKALAYICILAIYYYYL